MIEVLEREQERMQLVILSGARTPAQSKDLAEKSVKRRLRERRSSRLRLRDSAKGQAIFSPRARLRIHVVLSTGVR
jgi:hypothetical protein